MSDLLDKLKKLLDSIVNFHTKLGFKTVIGYVVIFLFVYGIINFRSCVVETIIFLEEVSEDIHREKMAQRDQYITDLYPMLTELRAELDADRILYFEYHNSEQNLDNLPFKFFDLVVSNCRYGVPVVLGESYKNVNSSMYIKLLNDINKGSILKCRGEFDTTFRRTYEGVYKLFYETDRSQQYIIFSVPGAKQPIGFIVLEWMDSEKEIVVDSETIHEFLPRITAASVSFSKKK